MRILISSHLFAPSIGGIEQVTELLAGEFAARGHQVRVITQSEAAADLSVTFPFTVMRRPRAADLVRQVHWCDVYFQNNLSVGTLWPIAFCRRPTVVSYQTWLTRVDGQLGLRERIKRLLTRAIWQNVAISAAIAESLPTRSRMIANPYRDQVFFRDERIVRDRELIFVGRLVSDKGADLLIKALARLVDDPAPRLTIVGGGPEEAKLRTLAADLDLEARVEFAGPVTGSKLAAMLNRHRVLAIPSRWSEPFGIVALEGLACGCEVVAARSGGLVDAIGPTGRLFTPGDVEDLAAELREALLAARVGSRTDGQLQEHLAAHTVERIANQYLVLFSSAMREYASD